MTTNSTYGTRDKALSLAVDWSAGPGADEAGHCSHEVVVAAARAFDTFLVGDDSTEVS